tara:strand:+ start:382 stop:1191 length:810 start_codon:yes stop_codon:yes gene_type:complete
MITNKKEIKINPELFKLSGAKNKTKKEKTKKQKPIINIKPTTIKRDLLKRIRERKNTVNNKYSFKSSVNLFEEISEKNNPTPVTQHTPPPTPTANKHIMQTSEINTPIVLEQHSESDTMLVQPVFQSNIQEQPPYSNMKNSSKPTYREWKNTTVKKPHPPVITDKIKYSVKGPNKKLIKHYAKFGKKNKTISVLIKDRATRKKIDNEIKTLKNDEISKVKEYLRERGLTKIGTHAPDDVLRQTYQDAFLTGDVINTSKETLVHNYINSK